MRLRERNRATKKAHSKLSQPDQQIIKELIAWVHIRNGNNHLDGSVGDIKISKVELENFLAYCLVLKGDK